MPTEDLRNDPSDSSPSERLDSWKEIAAYLRCSERTVRRWEEEGLPVHRHAHKKKAGIYAYKAEVDAWWRNGHERLREMESQTPVEPQKLLQMEAGEAPAGTDGNAKSSRLRRNVAASTIAVLSFGLIAVVLAARRDPVLQADHYLKMTNDGRDKSGNISVGIPSPIVTDGTRLFFVESEEKAGFFGLAQVSTSGGDSIPIPTPFQNLRLAGISPDRTHLLVGNIEGPTEAELPFYSVPTVGGSAQRLGNFLAHDAAWSPDGLSLVYATGESLYVAKSDGTAARKLVTGLGAVWWPRWSEDGKRLRFTITDLKTQENSIWEISAEGTHLRRISQEWDLPGDKCCGSWLPGGKYFMFQVSQLGVTSVWSVRENGPLWGKAHPVQLISGPIWASAAAASPDGKKLYIIGGQPRTEPIRYDREAKQFRSFLPGASVDSLEFTRDGKRVAYAQYPEGTLWRARSDGSERVQLTTGPLFATRPRWSPDGSSIVFFGQEPRRPWKLYLIPSNGGTPTQLIPGDANEGDPSWSPDGKRIVFGRLPWMPSAIEKPMLYVLDLASKQIAALPDSDELFSPRWSPSGRYVVALNSDSSKVMLYDFETAKWRQLAHGNLGNPDWSQDSAYVYTFNAQSNTVDRIRVSDGRMEPVASFKGERIAFTSMGPWTGLGPDNSVIATRDLSTQEIYTVELKAP